MLRFTSICLNLFAGQYNESYDTALRTGSGLTGAPGRLQNRLLFHLAHKRGDENKLMIYHQKLTDDTEDQLSLASIHYLRNHYQEATDIYKRLLLENREYLALNVYVALCYYKMDYYDVSLEILQVYLQQFPDSVVGVNLKACNHSRLYDGKAGEAELKKLADKQGISITQYDNDLVRHNLCVFRSGENAMQILPPLIDAIPEARLNLIIYHLKNEEYKDALQLMKDIEPSTPDEYILKGVIFACLGQIEDNREMLKSAQQYFQLVGASSSHCDTIPGRQSMAMCFFLLKQFDEVLIYLKSIKAYLFNVDEFNYNMGIAKCASGHYKDAEEHLTMVTNPKFKSEYSYIMALARSYIYNGKPRLSWELYLKLETSHESFNLVQLIANDCYKMGHFFYSLKAFDVLERLDPNPVFWDGKRGASVGAFQQIVAGREPRDNLREISIMLRNTENPQVEYILRAFKKWAKENGMKVRSILRVRLRLSTLRVFVLQLIFVTLC
uniref:Intraflagellar transport protein 56 n=1 Tax=Guillardia theta TaxID=55529 RepID=A0A7S4HAM1_GUITH|mmetsp:Transcript_12341/g.42982  ORF Transcript_12341/g.42982 Transcript_12341/m.42982 type:complete len:497 (+) Transcript_12341:161-1651(+)